jgi:citrate lyase beta subunit
VLRSLLFAPGGDEHKLERALESDAHAAVADLEDAVPAAEKATARATVARVLGRPRSGQALRFVRVNGADTPELAADLALVGDLDVDAIVLPKASPRAVRALGTAGPPVLALVETARGLRSAYDTACADRVFALMLGGVDLSAELRLEPRADGLELLYARSQLVVDSAAAGLRPPFDVVHLATRDEASLEAEARLARSLGFGGKACIHPAQVEVVNRAFRPAAAEVAWAHRVVAAAEDGLRAGRGAVALEGEMVDAPVIARARRIIEESESERVEG